MGLNNYPYLIAGLPELLLNYGKSDLDMDSALSHIRANIDKRDLQYMKWMEFGINPDNLSPHFYKAIFKSRNRFLKDYFKFDYDLRNITAAFLARENSLDIERFLLGDSTVTETIKSNKNEEFFGLEEIWVETYPLFRILSNKNILDRERQIDLLRWKKGEEISRSALFNRDQMFCIILKILIVRRWNNLEAEKGLELFKKLVEEVRGTLSSEQIDKMSNPN